MGNSQKLQSHGSQKNDFSLPPEIHLNFLNVNDIQDTEGQPYKIIYLVSPIFDGKKYEIRKAERRMTLVIIGDGDYQLNSNSIDYLAALKESGIKIDTLILNDLEVEPKVLKEILEFLKDDLLSLRLNRVSLDQAHVEILNEIQLNLKHLSLTYVLPDNKTPFDENNNGKNTSIDLNLINFGQQIGYLDLKGIPISQNIQKGIRQLNDLEHLFLENLVGNKNQNLEFMKSILENMHRFPKLNTLSLAGNNLSSINFAELQENSKSNSQETQFKFNKFK